MANSTCWKGVTPSAVDTSGFYTRSSLSLPRDNVRYPVPSKGVTPWSITYCVANAADRILVVVYHGEKTSR